MSDDVCRDAVAGSAGGAAGRDGKTRTREPALWALVERFSLGWLVAANTVGAGLAALLVSPGLGDATAPLTYGRWMPVHMDWQLYGWCALPLVGALLAWCVDERQPGARLQAGVALGAWSASLVMGAATWLSGLSSGKLFLDWHGGARGALSVAMLALWTVCAGHAWSRGPRDGVVERRLRAGALAALVFVPGLLYWSAGRDVYPSVNPDSGGATGASLLGSTLGIVTIFGMLPTMLRVPERCGGRLVGRARGGKRIGSGWFWGALAGSWVTFAAIDHGNASHHAAAQIGGLALLAIWVPLGWAWFRRFAWNEAAKPWLAAAFVWWLLLVASGWVTFLPGLSERLKFTNGLVGHAHLAMAGLVTCVNFVILRELSPCEEPRGNFWLWQGATAVHVTVLIALGWVEVERTGALFRSDDWTQAIYAVRLISGGLMAVASVRWLLAAWSRKRVTINSANNDAEVCQVSRGSGLDASRDRPVHGGGGRWWRSAGVVGRMARWLALGAGAMDFGTGLGLVFVPGWVLPLMGVATPGTDALVFLRWVGAFVGAVGASYLWAWWKGGSERLRSVLEVTAIFRLAAGGFSAAAIVRGWLSMAWLSVPVTDLALVAAQVWMLSVLRARVATDERRERP